MLFRSEELDNGMLSIEEAQQLLNEKKTAGMLQLSTGAAKLAVSSAAISEGLSQIESGLDTVESSREDALDKVADKIADAMMNAIKSATITYTTGLVAPAAGGPVTGKFECEIS